MLSECEAFKLGNYAAAAEYYENAIANEPSAWSHYCYLGLCLLLQQQEFEAQAVWYGAISEQNEAESEAWVHQLADILQHEATQQVNHEKFDNAWLIRRHLHEYCPNHINNSLHLILLAARLDRDIITEIDDLNLIEQLVALTDQPSVEQAHSIDAERLYELLAYVLKQYLLHPVAYDFAQVSCPILGQSSQLFELLLVSAIRLAYDLRQPTIAIRFAQLCLGLNLDNVEVLRHLSPFYQNAQQHQEGIEAARQCYELSQSLPDKIFANHLLLRGLTTAGGYWDEVKQVSDRHHQLIQAIMQDYPTDLQSARVLRLFTSLYELPYLGDTPLQFRSLQNQLAQLCQDNVRKYSSNIAKYTAHQKPGEKFPKVKRSRHKPLTIGYLSHCLGQHSVGWLARWLIQHHDRETFQINGYFQGYRQGLDALQEWYLKQFSTARIVGNNAIEIARQIQNDEVDILVDLDSITLDITCEVMALKPAPIQVSWLGWDASGIPAIDYFLADAYVLPDNAQEYYQETIWRLPHTYIAVDGFEIGVPTLRREDLGIPPDAIIYFSSQKGFKRHPDTVRLQMQILQAVPNSYFLIKGKADTDAVVQFFSALAEEAGVSRDRLKFLPWAASEAEHRANIGIADIVLDTYPYNGATTTLETLWMGIPLVTRVGEQFAARNSYTMMVNAGVEEGLAWTNDEYVEWGIRLGRDPALRQQIHWKLLQSRQTAPLWNAKAFTRELEAAYRKMWAHYCTHQHNPPQ